MTNSQQIEHQLEMAQGVQTALIPKARATTNLQFAIQSTPAGHVGGDICDVFETDRGRSALVIGDVCGKGVAAALLMGLVYGAMRSSAWTASTDDHEDAMERLNDLLRRKTSAERFATLFTAYYEPVSSTLRYINAGHLPMLLIRRKPGNFHIERLEGGGPLLGILNWGNYRQGNVHIEEGDLLVMFSDGVYDAMNAQGEQFGEERLLGVVRDHCDCSPEEIRNAIVTSVGEHAAECTIADDQTLIVARFQNVTAAGVLTSISDILHRGVIS
jgi:phosphoserine phosphatase RsbU/P